MYQSAVTIDLVTTAAALDRLAPAWADLWAADPAATPFQSPAWLVPWWHHFGNDRLLTIAATENGRLVGVVPLYAYRQADGRRDLFPLGVATTDYLGGTFADGRGGRVMAATFGALAERRRDFDRCEWPQLPAGSAMLDAPGPTGWADDRTPGEPCPVLPIAAGASALADLLPAKLMSNLRNRLRRARELGPVRVETAGDPDPSPVDLGGDADPMPVAPGDWRELYAALLDLHAARWRGRGEAGVLADPAVVAWHRDAIPRLLDAGTLRLHGLRVGGRLAAAFYGLSDGPAVPPDRRRDYYYLGGFDPALVKASPGALLLAHAVGRSVAAGRAAFDFLRGTEAYKYEWGAADEPTTRRVLTPPPIA